MTDNKKQPGPKGFILVDLVDRVQSAVGGGR